MVDIATPDDVEIEMWDPDQAVNIISISSDNQSFELHSDNLQKIISAVPKDMKVMVLSVVGDFRTGKSFLLSTFLRYLVYCEKNGVTNPEGMDWLLQGEDKLLEGNSISDQQTPGFEWKAGKDRTTTGIHMFGRPFIRKLKSGEDVAVLLMDTQGLFDHETPKDLTAAIFGLSTLISSYEIYNLAKQIPEDKLQQLHFFTEFSRTALKEFEKSQTRKNANVHQKMYAQLPDLSLPNSQFQHGFTL